MAHGPWDGCRPDDGARTTGYHLPYSNMVLLLPFLCLASAVRKYSYIRPGSFPERAPRGGSGSEVRVVGRCSAEPGDLTRCGLAQRSTRMLNAPATQGANA